MKGRAPLTAVLAAGMTVAGAVTIGAASAGAAAPGNQIVIRISNSHMRFSSGNTIRPGTYTFKVVSADGRDHTVQIARLHQGYTLAQARADLDKSFGGDTAAIRRIDDRITFRGGAEAHRKPGWFSTTLYATRYLVIDQNSDVVRYLTVTGSRRAGSAPATAGRSTAYSYGFGSSRRLPAHGWVRLFNQSDQPHFWVVQRIKEGTTARQVKRYFASGSEKNPPWLLRAGTDSGVISPYYGQNMHLDLPVGEYLTACFWPDDDTGMPHALMGMWQIVHLT
jgi:hypothetical protein